MLNPLHEDDLHLSSSLVATLPKTADDAGNVHHPAWNPLEGQAIGRGSEHPSGAECLGLQHPIHFHLQ